MSFDDGSRREFLKQALLASLAGMASNRPNGNGTDWASPPAATPPLPLPLPLLTAVAATLIPAGDGMPAAAEVGAQDYLERLAEREPLVRESLARSLGRVKDAAEHRGAPFERLEEDQRIALLRQVEATAPREFTALWYLVAEAYYLHPRVQPLLGHEIALTNSVGIRMKPFDEAMLERVKAMPKRYREIPDGR